MRGLALAALATSIVLSAAGQLGMKVGMRALHDVGGLATADWTALARPAAWTVLGLASYCMSLLAWLLVLARYPLSYAYPLLGLTYVLVYLAATSWPALAEPMTPLRTLGTLFVVAGVVLVSSTRAERAQQAGAHADDPPVAR